ncbi:MAG: efflux RND transporter periplasmic adaptor subunit [Pontiella sp.]|nr:efflux RND transporter periplasmic adaptor subunit [Pontiella sp.]
MHKSLVILGCLLAVLHAAGQEEKESAPACSCPSCLATAAGEEHPYTLPGLQGLNEESTVNAAVEADEHADCDHEGHDHSAHAEESHDDHDHDDHAGHDHADHAEGIELSAEMIRKVGLQIHEAEGRSIAKAAIFPAEIKLNGDRTAGVSPRFDSIVRQVFAEIGDAVSKGDVLASLENRATMAVYTVSAPFDGVIITKRLAVGETADAGQLLYEVADLSTVWADISIFPRYQHLVRKGIPVTFIAHDGHTAKGTVKYISPIISHETRTFTARCVLEGADEDFSPGAFVRAQINLETAEVPVAVPVEAVQSVDGEKVVFIPDEHGFQTVAVEPGLADQRYVEIRRGLKPGDRYVAVGAFALKAQMLTSGMDPHAGHGH